MLNRQAHVCQVKLN
uniref:Uncharacterized protein n=1 Tax=Anguilla anguilla TaxID=7936 RepID=A0A0E9UHI0_ANGAN